MVIYYGFYSQAARGKRKKDGTHYSKCITSQAEDSNRILKYRWSALIKKVYADPLICPNCGGRMKIIAFIKKNSQIPYTRDLSESLYHNENSLANYGFSCLCSTK